MQRRDDARRPSHSPEVERLRRDLERVERERDRFERDAGRLQKRNRRLEDKVTRLERELDAARRAGCRQAAPFAKPRVRDPKKPGRRPGAAYGVPARRPAPGRVDEHCDVPLPPDCPRCGGQVQATGTVAQVQEELPVPRVVVRRFRVAVGACRACGRRVRGRHRLQSSDAVGARPAAGGLGRHPQQAVGAVVRQGDDAAAAAVRRHGQPGRAGARGRTGRPAGAADLCGPARSGPRQPRRHAGRDRVEGRRRPPVAVGGGHPADDRLPHPARPRLAAGRPAARRRLRRRARPRRLGAVPAVHGGDPSDVSGASAAPGPHAARRPSAQPRRRRHPDRLAAGPPPARRGPHRRPAARRHRPGPRRADRPPRRTAGPARTARRRATLRQPPPHRMDGAVHLPAQSRRRRRQPARRTGHPPCRRHPQGLRRQPLLAGSRNAAGARFGHPHRHPTSVQSPRRDHRPPPIACPHRRTRTQS